MIENKKKQDFKNKSVQDWQSLLNQTKKEIDKQSKKLTKALEEKNISAVKKEYKEIVNLFAKKLGIETALLDQELSNKDLNQEKRDALLSEKKDLLKDYQKTVVILAYQIEDLVGDLKNKK